MTKDFTSWARQDLVLRLDGREYRSRPPTVEESPLLLAIAVRVEIQARLGTGTMPDDLAALLREHADKTVAQISLRQETVDALHADQVPEETINRMGLYAALYWARGEAQADVVAELAWGQEAQEDTGPKDRKGSTSGPSTASASPTSSASTRTTGSRSTSSRKRGRRKGTTTA